MSRERLIRDAARIIHEGGVIAYPTEAVYGLGCDPGNPTAVGRILRIKQRRLREGLILVAADLAQLAPWIAPLPADVVSTLEAEWPGPVTFIVPAAVDCPAWITGEHEGIAVRVSAHPIVRAICEAAGSAIVSTSANRRGRQPTRSTLACRLRFGELVDLVIPGETGGRERCSEIRDALSGKVVRAG